MTQQRTATIKLISAMLIFGSIGLFVRYISVPSALIALVRAVIGPRIADRLVSVNMMGTMIMCIIVILGVVLEEGYLADYLACCDMDYLEY